MSKTAIENEQDVYDIISEALRGSRRTLRSGIALDTDEIIKRLSHAGLPIDVMVAAAKMYRAGYKAAHFATTVLDERIA